MKLQILGTQPKSMWPEYFDKEFTIMVSSSGWDIYHFYLGGIWVWIYIGTMPEVS